MDDIETESMMRKPVKIAVVAAVTGVLVAGASGAVAFAAANDGPSARPSTSTRTTTSAQPSASSARPAAGEVSRATAEAAARAAVPGATVTETDRDLEHGRAVWEIDLTRGGREYEVDVDAHTGKVVKVDRDRHDAGTRDDDDDHDDHGRHGHDGGDDGGDDD